MEPSGTLNRKDALTNFHTKEGLFEYLSSKTQAVYTRSSKLSVIILDLDNFKGINDTYGHLVGDDALRYFAMVINKALKGQHFVARYGGDEFVVVMQDSQDGRESVEVTKRVRVILNKEKFFTPKGPINIKTSIGIATYPDDSKTPRGVLDAADQALYYAKEHGRNKTINSHSLKKRSVFDKSLTTIKLAVIALILLSAVGAYLKTHSLRGIVAYYKNISQFISFDRHQKQKKYNYSSFEFKDGKKLEGWIIAEDDDNATLSVTKPIFYFNPLRFEIPTQPIIIPKSTIQASINVLKK